MDIKLKWTNRNVLPVKTKIYRTETVTPPANLPAALVELDGALTEYTDTTAVRYKTYYYVFETFTETEKVYSNPLIVVADYNYGPGPRNLLWGDTRYGYFGTVSSIDFFQPSDLAEVFNSPPALPTNTLPLWHKWIRRGKICYVPTVAVNTSISYINIYNSGLFFGTNDNGPFVPTGAVATNQRKIISRGFDKFIVRLPTGSDDRAGNYTIPDGSPASIKRYSELADFIYPMLADSVCPTQRSPKIDLNTTYTILANARTVPASTRNASNVPCKGLSWPIPSITAGGTVGEAIEGMLYDTWTATTSFVPVLEMIHNNAVTVEAKL